MHRSLFWTAIAAVVVTGTAAQADSPKLKGTYAFTGMATCLYSGGHFTSDLRPTVWPGWTETVPGPNGPVPNPVGNGIFASSFSVEGMRTFNGDNTGSISGRALEIVGPPSIRPRVIVEDFAASFTYAVDGHGGFHTELAADGLLGTQVAPLAGQRVKTSGFTLDGLIGNDSAVLTLASTPDAPPATMKDAVEETQTALDQPFTTINGNPIFVRYRVCSRSRVLVRMNEGDLHSSGKDD